MNQRRDFARTLSAPLARGHTSFLTLSFVVGVALVIASWTYILQSDRLQSQGFFSLETIHRGWVFVRDLLGIGSSSSPAFARWSEWRQALRLAYDTLAMSVLGAGIAAIFALSTLIFGARNVMVGELAPYRSWLWRGIFFLVRGLFIFTRGIPELVWAMLIVFVLAPGILPGALALGIHNAGIIGKLASEVVEGLDARPIRALRSSGAGRIQVMLYGVLPEALPKFMTYLFYRWEVIIRTTIVVGFVAAGDRKSTRLNSSHRL